MSPTIAAVVPSLGAAPGSDEMLRRLRSELAEVEGDLIWVHQGSAPAPNLSGRRERRLDLPRRAGFAAAVNRGIGATGAEWVAVINDDLWLEPGWLAALLAAGGARPEAGALQGLNLTLADPGRIDGAGIGWNRRWEAVQIGHGAAAEEAAGDDAPREVFGVSATGALFRRAALAATALGEHLYFDERLDSWYEDVELAARLAAGGWRALVVPSARALHRGSATGTAMPFARRRLLTRNRLLVTARLLGRGWWSAVPPIALADLREFARALGRGAVGDGAAIVAGWLTATARIGAYLHLGAPSLPASRLGAMRVGSAR